MTRSLAGACLVLASLAATAGGAAARDVLNAAVANILPNSFVDPGGDPGPAFRDSGQIKIQYVLNAPSFSTNAAFGSFTLKLKGVVATATNTTVYPATIEIADNGDNADHNLRLSVASSLVLSATGVENTTGVTVQVQCGGGGGVPACPTGTGTTIDRHLQFTETTNTGGRVMTTSVQVHVSIMLIVPVAEQCLAMANIVTDQGWTQRLDTTELVVIANGKNANTVRATTPFGQHSQDVAVVNNENCSELKDFDLKVELDPRYETNPNNNPGNATFLYLSDDPIDLSSTIFTVNAVGTPQQQKLCLKGQSLDPGSSLLVRVHMQIKRGLNILSDPVWTTPPAPGDFEFKAALYPSGSDCSGTPILTATTYKLPYTIR
jgi:hypothetical protein